MGKNWIVRVYNRTDKIIATWTIDNRTESQAEKEAMADIRHMGGYAADWSMMETA